MPSSSWVSNAITPSQHRTGDSLLAMKRNSDTHPWLESNLSVRAWVSPGWQMLKGEAPELLCHYCASEEQVRKQNDLNCNTHKKEDCLYDTSFVVDEKLKLSSHIVLYCCYSCLHVEATTASWCGCGCGIMYRGSLLCVRIMGSTSHDIVSIVVTTIMKKIYNCVLKKRIVA